MDGFEIFVLSRTIQGFTYHQPLKKSTNEKFSSHAAFHYNTWKKLPKFFNGGENDLNGEEFDVNSSYVRLMEIQVRLFTIICDKRAKKEKNSAICENNAKQGEKLI